MPKSDWDRDKLRAYVRKLRRRDLLALFDRAVDLLPKTRIPSLVDGYVDPDSLKADGPGASLLDTVTGFRDASLRGEYYEAFDVDSKNFMELSRGTEAWMAECDRLLDRCRKAAERRPDGGARAAFEILFDLLRHVDEGHDDVVFFADEGGSWQVGVPWRTVLPAYFRALAVDAGPEEYAGAVLRVIEDFDEWDRKRQLARARAAASPAQKRALRGA